LSNHAGIPNLNPFNNLAMTLKIKQFQLSNLNNTMIQYMDQSNKNSSNDDFNNVSKDGITLGDLSYRESINEGCGEESGISHQGNSPKNIVIQN
jgi:hypothetical protein